MKPRSLTSKLLAVVLVLCLSATSVCAAAGFLAFKANFVRERAQTLDFAVVERARTQGYIFNLVKRQAATASGLLNRPVPPLLHVDQRFNAVFPVHGPNGARAGAASLFTGQPLFGGDMAFDMGARVAAADARTLQGKLLIMRVFHTVRLVGESGLNGLGNLAFLTPNGSVLVFNPNGSKEFANLRTLTDDRPMRTMVQGAGPAANPTGQTVCAPLLIPGHSKGPDTGKMLVRSCTTPAYFDGRFVGAWNTLLNVSDYLPVEDQAQDPTALNLLVDERGEPVAVSGPVRASLPTPEQARAYKATLGLTQLAAHFRRDPEGHGVADAPGRRWLIAFAKVEGAPWFLVTAVPEGPIEAKAEASAFAMVGAGVLALLTTSLLIFLYARKDIVDPLHRLALHSARVRSPVAGVAQGAPAICDLEARDDEIGELARRLAEERALADGVLQSLEERVADRTAELERANRAKSTFLANMSHELRTPLNGVIALSDILASRQTTDEDRATAELVVSSARLLEQVLTDILDVSKVEAGQMMLCVEPFDLEATVGRIAELHRAAAMAKAKRVDLTWSVAPEARGRYLGDQVRITQILSNLLSNAVKFTAEGEVALTVETAADGLTIAVRDTGVGFAQDMADRLFRRFEQADASTTRQFGGTGLGLAICASLCELMGGSISAVSAPGWGATFTVVLPLQRFETAAPAASEPASDAREIGALEGLRVLQAEDHPTNQKVVALSLEPFGVDLTTVGNGALAVDEAAKTRFDVILMDLHMPVMDGLTAIGRIRAQEAVAGGARTPIIALTADALTDQVKAALAAGADLHLAKPIRPQDLVMAILGVLGDEPVGDQSDRATA